VLKRDKKQFQVKLLNKDLRIYPKERRDEILLGRVFLDQDSSSEALMLVVDKSSAEKNESPFALSEGARESAESRPSAILEERPSDVANESGGSDEEVEGS